VSEVTPLTFLSLPTPYMPTAPLFFQQLTEDGAIDKIS
jgi:hypothetical protein